MSEPDVSDSLRALWDRMFEEAIQEWDGFVAKTARFVVVQRGLFFAFTYVDTDRDIMVHLTRYVHDTTMNVVKIRIGEPMRGKGLGESLYNVLLRFGKRTGVDWVMLFPSGIAKTKHEDKSRLAYMLRRGWELVPGDDPDPEVRKRCC